MDSIWERTESALLRIARWLACPQRRIAQAPTLPDPEEMRAGLDMDDSDKTREALAFCKELFEREEKRTETLESKSITLMGFAGLTAALVSASAALLLDTDKIQCEPLLAILSLLYVFLVYSFVRSILCALMVVRVGDPYWFASPAAQDILDLRLQDVDHVRMQWALDYLHSYVKNHTINNDKAGYLISAQRGFAVAMLLLFAIAIVFVSYAVRTMILSM
jgi:hypothetical protein